MKKLILISLFFLIFSLVSSSAFALLVTDNTDSDNFLYEVPLNFATKDLAASKSAEAFPVLGLTSDNTQYTLLRDGKLVGISVAGNVAYQAGGATFDVTINGNVTGLQAWIQPVTIAAVGNSGSIGSQYSYMRQYRDTTTVAQGFRQPSGNTGAGFHNAENPYGKATALSAGDRIGVKVTTSSTMNPTTNDYVVTVYVLE